MRALAAVVLIAAAATPGAADGPRAGRPRVVSGGVSVMGIVSSEPIPFLTASAVFDQGPQWSLAVSGSYFTSDDRIFGPRVMVHAGVRRYLHDRRSNPFVAAVVSVYHEHSTSTIRTRIGRNRPAPPSAVAPPSATNW